MTVEITTQGLIDEGEPTSGSGAGGRWTEADIATISAAIAGGVKRVRYAGPPEREVEYQSLAEMRRLRAQMIAEVDGSPRHRYAVFRRGFRRGRPVRFRSNG